MSFKSYSFSPEIMSQIEAKGYHKPTPIQEKAIPVVLEGHDVMGLAQTGTGKTAAFAIPLIQQIDPKIRRVQALVLAPTRELAVQVAENIHKLGRIQSDATHRRQLRDLSARAVAH